MADWPVIGVFPVGSVSAPSISFEGNPDTGIYSPGVDEIAYATTGVARWWIDAAGRMATGGSAPVTGALFQIGGAHPSGGDVIQYGIVANPTFSEDATTSGQALRVAGVLPNTVFTMNTAYGLVVANITKPANPTINSLYGISVVAQSGATNNYGVAIGAASTQTLWVSSDANNITAAAGIAFGASRDTVIYRGAAATLGVTGIIQASDGAAATPAFSFVSDPDTGMYRFAANTLVLTTNGATAVYIDSTRRVGIGGGPSTSARFGTSAAVAFNPAVTTLVQMEAVGAIGANATVEATAFRAQLATSTSVTTTTGAGIHVLNSSLGASTAIATQYGILVDAQTGGTLTMGVAIGAATTQTLWVSSNADNTTASAGIAFGVSRDIAIYRGASGLLQTNGGFKLLTNGGGGPDQTLAIEGSSSKKRYLRVNASGDLEFVNNAFSSVVESIRDDGYFAAHDTGGYTWFAGDVAINRVAANMAGMAAGDSFMSEAYRVGSTTGPVIISGAGAPSGAAAGAAPLGSLWLRTDGSTATSLYVKTVAGNPGTWTAK